MCYSVSLDSKCRIMFDILCTDEYLDGERYTNMKLVTIWCSRLQIWFYVWDRKWKISSYLKYGSAWTIISLQRTNAPSYYLFMNMYIQNFDFKPAKKVRFKLEYYWQYLYNFHRPYLRFSNFLTLFKQNSKNWKTWPYI